MRRAGQIGERAQLSWRIQAQLRANPSFPDILVNNAGQGCVGALAEVDMEKVRGAFETNVFGLLSTSQAVSKSMIASRKGLSECRNGDRWPLLVRSTVGPCSLAVVNISSIVSFVPTPWAGSECGIRSEASCGTDEGRPVYCATKASVTSLSDVLRMELGGFGIQVMCVFPGAIKSDIGAANAASASHTQGGPYANVRHHIEARGSWSQGECVWQYYRATPHPSLCPGGPHSTPAADLAARIVKSALLPSPPHYLTAGHRSTRAWLSYYLPARWKDYFWGTRYFGLEEVGHERPTL